MILVFIVPGLFIGLCFSLLIRFLAYKNKLSKRFLVVSTSVLLFILLTVLAVSLAVKGASIDAIWPALGLLIGLAVMIIMGVWATFVISVMAPSVTIGVGNLFADSKSIQMHKERQKVVADKALAFLRSPKGQTLSASRRLWELKAARKADPENHEVRYLLAKAYFEIGKRELAAQEIKAAIELMPDVQEYKDFQRTLTERIS